jgi:hypothetical protein
VQRLLTSLAVGLFGACLAFVLLHMLQDHLWDDTMRQIQRQQLQQLQQQQQQQAK